MSFTGFLSIYRAASWVELISSIILGLYCIVFYRAKARNAFYYIGFGLQILLPLFDIVNKCFVSVSPLLVPIPFSLLYICFLISMMIFNFKKGKGLFWVSGVLLSIYTVTYIVMQGVAIAATSGGSAISTAFSELVLLAKLIALAAFFILWWNKGKKYISSSSSRPAVSSSAEHDLAALQKAYEAGSIDEREYAARRKQILRKI